MVALEHYQRRDLSWTLKAFYMNVVSQKAPWLKLGCKTGLCHERRAARRSDYGLQGPKRPRLPPISVVTLFSDPASPCLSASA